MTVSVEACGIGSERCWIDVNVKETMDVLNNVGAFGLGKRNGVEWNILEA